MDDLHGKVAVVTSADSGIGRHPAYNLAAEGCCPALADTDDTDCRSFGVPTSRGAVHGPLAFLPSLRQRREASIVNVASVHSLFTNPGFVAYCAGKFAVRGFSLTLAQELRDTSVRVSRGYPGGVRTSIIRNSLTAAATVSLSARRTLKRALMDSSAEPVRTKPPRSSSKESGSGDRRKASERKKRKEKKTNELPVYR